MKHIKKFNEANSSENFERKNAFKKLLNTFIQEIYGLGGIQLKFSFLKKENNNPKFTEIYDFINRISTSFKKDITTDYKWYYENVKELTNIIYKAINYLKPNFENLNFDKDKIKKMLLSQLEKITNSYLDFIKLYN